MTRIHRGSQHCYARYEKTKVLCLKQGFSGFSPPHRQSHRIEKQPQKRVKDTSRAARFAVLVDPAANAWIDGVMQVVDDHTVNLTRPGPDAIRRSNGMARIEPLIRTQGVTGRPSRCSLCNHTAANLHGTGHHIAFARRPDKLYGSQITGRQAR